VSNLAFIAVSRPEAKARGPYAGYHSGWYRDFAATRYGRDVGEFGYTFGA
jgi:hypothetical protein